MLLLLFSVLSITLHRLGAFKTHFDLLDPKHNFAYVPNSQTGGEPNARVTFADGVLRMTCQVLDLDFYRHCGVSIKMHEDPAMGMDFSGYNNVYLDIKYTHPDTSNTGLYRPIQMLFRNFDARYATHSNHSSLKYNSVQFVPSPNLLTQPIPMDSLQVATWWINEYEIPYVDAQPDLTNTSLVEIETASVTRVGTYDIAVKKIMLQGYLFSENTLIKALLVMWLLATLYMVNRQHKILSVMSSRDPLTQVMNRRGLSQWLSRYLDEGHKGASIVMYYIDIDGFKKINDNYGHVMGDRLLCEFCSVIETELHKMNIQDIARDHLLARLSGDEFALVFEGLSAHHTELIAAKLLERLNDVILVGGVEIKVDASIGISKSSSEANAAAVLMSNADAAMYHSKKNGKNHFKSYDDDVFEDITFRKNIASAIKFAIKKELFSIVIMPIYYAHDLSVRGGEVLVRCHEPSLVKLGPDVFIPVAEEYGLIREIDLWVIEETFKQISLSRELYERAQQTFCINISALELVNQEFPSQLKRLLKKYYINPQWIELEVTETSLIDVDEHSIQLLHAIKSLGVQLSLDDFGTGYTAFNQLLNYPVGCLKIDRSFVGSLSNNDATMVDVILGIAESYELSVVAEGVETKAQLEYLQGKNCEFIQGYCLSKPISWAEYDCLIVSGSRSRAHNVLSEPAY